MGTLLLEGRRIEVRGTVQGVGFRPWVYRLARDASVTGRVRNHTAGVTIEVFGEPGSIARFLGQLSAAPPPAAAIDTLTAEPIPFERAERFEIVESARQADRRIAIPPDLATCPECASEVLDPSNRRHAYPFTNCTNCGPRFTIVESAPYDRPNTSMRAFAMCPACQREYDSVEDRRFHAQPNACPVCGPALRAVTGRGLPVVGADPIEIALRFLNDGLIVAIKGIGGFHLACDATSEDAVSRLRERKKRDEKPFAVMAPTLDRARLLALMTADDQRLLTSVERPIVLVTRREPTELASSVAPGNPLVGLLLPYSPLHQILLRGFAKPLVMTSGNVAEEPIAFENAEAVRRLGGIADLLVLHDRAIVTRCDDSIARTIGGRSVVLRRSRGYVPRAIALEHPVARPVLGCGALLKNTFCLASGDEACLGPHVGDLENLATFTSYRESIARMQRFLGIEPEIVAHDLHPDYLSTRYALSLPGLTAVAVQHHHAHVASAMAEHGLEGSVIGVAYDGTGLGTDGTAWGGEILIADYRGFERVATFRPLPLAGGDAAIRQPWRTALALADDAFDGETPIGKLRLFQQVPANDLQVVRRMIREGLNAPKAHGVGRYFDAFGALGLARPRSAYEGQIALEWNAIADPREGGRYPYTVCRDGAPWELDLRAAVRGAVGELLAGESAALVAARFHNTIAAATADLVRAVARVRGRLPVVLTGGCFQNARLAEGLSDLLASEFTVYRHEKVPPGDGGIALGQAVVAAETCKVQGAAFSVPCTLAAP